MKLFNTSTLCVCNFIMRVYSTLVMLCFCGDYIVGKFLFSLKIMLQLLLVTLPLELRAFQEDSTKMTFQDTKMVLVER
jgi:hypothetical protein